MQALWPISETHKFPSNEKLKTKSIVGGGGGKGGKPAKKSHKRETIVLLLLLYFYWLSVARVH